MWSLCDVALCFLNLMGPAFHFLVRAIQKALDVTIMFSISYTELPKRALYHVFPITGWPKRALQLCFLNIATQVCSPLKLQSLCTHLKRAPPPLT